MEKYLGYTKLQASHIVRGIFAALATTTFPDLNELNKMLAAWGLEITEKK